MIEKDFTSGISLDDGIILDAESIQEEEDEQEDIVVTSNINQPPSLDLDDGIILDDNDVINTAVTDDIPEDHEVKAEVEKDIPPSQDTLYTRYKEKYPQLFQDGQLVDYDAAKEIGIITEVSAVPGDDEAVTAGHVSTVSDDAPFGFSYNAEAQAETIMETP